MQNHLHGLPSAEKERIINDRIVEMRQRYEGEPVLDVRKHKWPSADGRLWSADWVAFCINEEIVNFSKWSLGRRCRRYGTRDKVIAIEQYARELCAKYYEDHPEQRVH